MDTVRPLLQSVTHNLPGPIRDLGVSIIGHKCYQSLLMDINVEDVDCIKYGVSKGLGIAIIGASTIVKVPQIIKLVRSRSAEGVSFLSYLLETVAYLVTLAYNYRNGFPFSTYGETALILVQNIVISTLILRYSGQNGAAAGLLGGLSSLAMVLFTGNYIGEKNLGYLQAGAGVLGIASKLPQILTIFSEGTTGQLSAFTVFNYLGGSLSRIFTTLQEVDDKLILYGFVAGFSLNLVLALQMVYYWNAPSAKAKGKRKATRKSPTKRSSSKPPAKRSSSRSPTKSEGKATGSSPKKTPTRRRG